jgi:hypothetical protein
MAEREQARIVANQKLGAARALEVFKDLTSTPKGRKAFKASPREAFDHHKRTLDEVTLRRARYTSIPVNTRTALEALSLRELELLSNLDATFVKDGLYVDVPSPGMLHYH